ncbi:Deoxyuridine 5'-triphosphate nucleotidohydrolase [compost metagenome]
MDTIELKVKRLHEDAQLPTYGTAGAACFDLHALHCGIVTNTGAQVFRTGLAFDIPAGWVLKVYSRSGHGFKNSVRLGNAVGIIDADYVGELMVKLTCDDPFGELRVSKGDRIAQAMLEPAPRVQLIEVAELKDTARGAAGFGSTGR